MLQIIIFSFDRALQLNALIESLTDKWETPTYHVDILYNTSSPKFEAGYEKLKRTFTSNLSISFHRESKCSAGYSLREYCNISNLKRLWKAPYLRHPKTDFRPMLIKLMEDSASDTVMFLTDDAIFINDVKLDSEIFKFIAQKPLQRSFSLRLGANMNNPPHGIQRKGEYILWDFYDHPFMSNWGFPFSVDAHIYNKTSLLNIFHKIIFSNPNSLEGVIAFYAKRHKLFSQGMCDHIPSILSYPINMVQDVQDNASLGVSVDKLNEKYLDGYKLRYPISANPDTFQQYPEELYLDCDDKTELLQTKS